MRRVLLGLSLALTCAGVWVSTAGAAATEVAQTAFVCGYDGSTNTFLPVVDVTRSAGTDTRVTVIMHFYDGPSTGPQQASLSAGRIESDGSITHGASTVAVGETRQYTPWGGAFGDGNFGGPALAYNHTYTVHVVVTDFDEGDTNVVDYPCKTGPPPQRTLTVVHAGTGAGTVTSKDHKISCGTGCSASYPDGTSVTLAEAAAKGSRFSGWDAPECSSSASSCTVTLTADRTVTAHFQVETEPAEECHGILTSGFNPFEKEPDPDKAKLVSLKLSFSLASADFCLSGISGLTASPSTTGLTFSAPIPPLNYSFELSTLSWHRVSGDGGEPSPASAAFTWKNFHPELPPSALGIDLAWHKGQLPEPSFTLGKVEFPVLSSTLYNHGGALLHAAIGPEVDLGVAVNVEKLAELIKKRIAQGEPAAAAAEETAEEVKTSVRLVYEDAEGDLRQWAVGSDSSFTGDAQAAVDEFGDAAASELAEEPLVDISIAQEVAADEAAIDAEAIEATELVGEEELLLDTLEVGLLARDQHHPPAVAAADLVQTATLTAKPLHHFKVRRMHVGPFPKRQVKSMAQRGVVSIPVPTHAGKLLLSTTKLRPRAKVAVVAPKLLRGKPHAALLVLAGPGYRATRLVKVYRGIVAVSFKLPAKLHPGLWTIAVQDISGVQLAHGSHRLTGKSEIRAAVIKVRR